MRRPSGKRSAQMNACGVPLPPFFTRTVIVFLPGLSHGVMSRKRRWFQRSTCPKWRWNSFPFTSISCRVDAAWSSSTYSPGFAPAKSKSREITTSPRALGLAVIQRAPARSASGRVSGAGPIHFAFQPSGGRMPVTHVAGALQALSAPVPSHVRTFHQYRHEEASGFPAYATSIDCAP